MTCRVCMENKTDAEKEIQHSGKVKEIFIAVNKAIKSPAEKII